MECSYYSFMTVRSSGVCLVYFSADVVLPALLPVSPLVLTSFKAVTLLAWWQECL